MKFLIISDIHSNLEALVSVFSDLHSNNEKIDRILIPGDIVGYGPNPNECCTIVRFLNNGKSFLKREIQELIQEVDLDDADKKNIIDYIFSMGNKANVVAGNHDKEVIGQPSLCSVMAASAGNAAKWTTKVLQKPNARFLDSLCYKKRIRKFGIELVHSTPVYPQGYRYVKNAATLNYDILHSSITISGHTHKPSAYLYTKQKRDISASVFIPTDQFDNRLMLVERESMERQETFDISLASGQRYYINSGSVGQPRDGTPKASYMIYDTVAKQASLRKAAYNTEIVKKKVLKATLPFDLAERIVKGV
ncbi:MAG: metallophosphoesterase family protein [Candidatus Scalindua sp.]|jgi:predicted phosphodiesterase|nr:metallophosphoesterase family protein [Candidatus Scalindua sp.]MDV5167003.1 metallophosphoesterase family protein [Candidatus Scalindua sp.]